MPGGNDTQTGNPIYGHSLADASIGNAKLGEGSVSTTKVFDRAITTPKLADLSVTTDKIADGAITATELAAGAVTASAIADGAVTISQLAALTTSANSPVSGTGSGFVAGLNVSVTPTSASRPVLVCLYPGSSLGYVFSQGTGTTNGALLSVNWQIYRGTSGAGSGSAIRSGNAQISSLASGQAHTLVANPSMTFLDYLTPGSTYTYSLFIGSGNANVSSSVFGVVQLVLSATAL